MRFSFQISLCLLLLGFSSNLSAQVDSRKCTIKSLIGDVNIRRGTAVNWVDARPNMPLRENDAIRTLIESEILLETSEGTSLKVGENSTIEMAVFSAKGETQNTKIKILSGSLVSTVKKRLTIQSRFEFETPTATAAMSGAVLSFHVSNEGTLIKVYEGSVLVTSERLKSSVLLKENQMVSIKKSQKDITIQKLEENNEHQSIKTNNTEK